MATVIISADECRALYAAQASTFQGRPIGRSGILPVSAHTAHSYPQDEHVDSMQPWWVTRESHQDVFAGVLFVDPALPVFEGHFPNNPLLPGILQIDWAISAAAESFADLPANAFSGMSRIKFKAPVRPASWLTLKLVRQEPHVTFTFAIPEAGLDTICTEGKLDYRG